MFCIVFGGTCFFLGFYFGALSVVLHDRRKRGVK